MICPDCNGNGEAIYYEYFGTDFAKNTVNIKPKKDICRTCNGSGHTTQTNADRIRAMSDEELALPEEDYYVLRNTETGMYFRGKGVNRWGKHFNKATIYRVKGTAEHSIKEVAWHGEKAELVRIKIVEMPKPSKEEAQQDCTYNKNGHCMGQKMMPECDAKNCDRRK